MLAIFTGCIEIAAQNIAPEVLSRQVVQLQDHKIIFERITPPVPATPPTVSLQTNAALPRQIVSVSCTVYGHEFTEMRWHDLAGGEYVIWSSIDFTPFTGRLSGGFDLGGVHYEVFMGLGEAPSSEALAPLAAFHAIMPPAEPGSWYAIMSQPASVADAAYSGIDALHLHFDANKTAILAEHEAVKASNAALQAQRVVRPSLKQDTVIRFWPIQSVLHGAQPEEGQP